MLGCASPRSDADLAADLVSRADFLRGFRSAQGASPPWVTSCRQPRVHAEPERRGHAQLARPCRKLEGRAHSRGGFHSFPFRVMEKSGWPVLPGARHQPAGARGSRRVAASSSARYHAHLPAHRSVMATAFAFCVRHGRFPAARIEPEPWPGRKDAGAQRPAFPRLRHGDCIA